jgi:putative N6-adenine-specific DNA methylase
MLNYPPSEDNKAFWRQVRRHLQAQDHVFAAVVPRELQVLCRQELEALGIGGLRLSEAGVEFRGRLSACMQANLWLRTASRVLCRLPDFRVGVVGELFHKVAAIPWEYWLNALLPVAIQSHAARSRVDHEGTIAETVVRAIQHRFREGGFPVPELGAGSRGGTHAGEAMWVQRILVRVVSNRCEISLDTTGCHLHQRGYRRQHTGAPLRETLAAAILFHSGWRAGRPLLDGLCGAGTVAIEAALLARRIPPGGEREFLFEKWPGHQTKTWQYLRRKAREAALPRASTPIVGLDRDERALGIARENALRAGVGEDIRWDAGDFLTFHPAALDLERGLVVLDPPYGIRTQGTADLPGFYRRLGAHLRAAFTGWQVAVVTPSLDLARELGFRRSRRWWLPHGGTPVCVCMTTIG